MRSVDKTLFTLNHGTDFLLVQIYVDDIIFGDSSHTLVSRFQEMMESEFVHDGRSILFPRYPDENGEAMDQREYMSMIGSLLYLIATRPDI
jgi:hypothetical protein